MFRFVLTILTATTFVAHGLFGCCWHHGHAHLVSQVAGLEQRSHCHEHGHSHGESAASCGEDGHSPGHDSHSPHEGQCDEDQCVFARTQDGPQLTGDVLLAWYVSLVATAPDCGLQMPSAGLSAIAAQNCNGSLSAPVCALSQLWLI